MLLGRVDYALGELFIAGIIAGLYDIVACTEVFALFDLRVFVRRGKYGYVNSLKAWI